MAPALAPVKRVMMIDVLLIPSNRENGNTETGNEISD